MYILAEEAVEEVQIRWNNRLLRQRVLEYTGSLPFDPRRSPCAIMARHIISPTHALLRFIELSQNLSLPRIALEYSGDLFYKKNPDKMALLSLNFTDRADGLDAEIFHVADHELYHNKPLSHVITYNNLDLQSYHHCLLDDIQNASDVRIFDTSFWHKQSYRGSKILLYSKFLAFFICHGVLFENFLCSGPEGAFTNGVVLPAIDLLKNKFGVDPLIVKLLPSNSESSYYWNSYPVKLKQPAIAISRERIMPVAI